MDPTLILLLILVALVAIWLTIGGFAAWLAREKSRDTGAWFLLGPVFGPIAILTLGLAPEGGRTASCPRCREHLWPTAAMCPFCGLELSPDDGTRDQTWEQIGAWRVTAVHDDELDVDVGRDVIIAFGRRQLFLLADAAPLVWFPYSEAEIVPLGDSRFRLDSSDGQVVSLVRASGPSVEEIAQMVRARQALAAPATTSSSRIA